MRSVCEGPHYRKKRMILSQKKKRHPRMMMMKLIVVKRMMQKMTLNLSRQTVMPVNLKMMTLMTLGEKVTVLLIYLFIAVLFYYDCTISCCFRMIEIVFFINIQN